MTKAHIGRKIRKTAKRMLKSSRVAGRALGKGTGFATEQSIGYLKFKKNVYNKMNQSIVRYVIDYKDVDGNIVISKKYSSIKQVSCDIGSGKSSSVYYIVKKL